uniref:Uncharacterized protein n=1 Tax=Moniliophthora roreri TaxID=221103 RepID=A0A0W0G8F8_MONRR
MTSTITTGPFVTVRHPQPGEAPQSPTKSSSKTPPTPAFPKPWDNLDDLERDGTLPTRSFTTPANDFMEEFERHTEKSNRRIDKPGASRKTAKSNKKSSKRAGKFDDDPDTDEYSRWMEEEVEWGRGE